MEVLLQYWDELDDAFHSARFLVVRSRLRWLGLVTTALLLGSCASLF